MPASSGEALSTKSGEDLEATYGEAASDEHLGKMQASSCKAFPETSLHWLSFPSEHSLRLAMVHSELRLKGCAALR